MNQIEVTQKLAESQRQSIKTQLLDLGIKVTVANPKGEDIWIGYIDTFTVTMDPIKVNIRYNEGIEPLSPRQSKGFKFILKAGRFVLHKGK